MKEKLINFTRSKENEEKVEKGYLILLITLLIILLIIKVLSKNLSLEIPTVIKIILTILTLISMFSWHAIDILFETGEDIIRKNKLILILLSKERFVTRVILILVMIFMPILVHIQFRIVTAIFLGIVLAVLDIIISSKISKYFSGKLKR